MKPEIQAKFRDYCVDEGIKAGKFPPSRRDHYRRLWDADPDGTMKLIDGLAAALPVNEIGTAGTVEAEPSEYPREWLGRTAEAVDAARAGKTVTRSVTIAKD